MTCFRSHALDRHDNEVIALERQGKPEGRMSESMIAAISIKEDQQGQ